MRVLKLLGALGLCVALLSIWNRRSWVLDAYRTEHTVTEVTFEGLDLSVERVPLAASIHDRHRRPSGADAVVPPALGFDPVPVPVVGADPAMEGGDASLWGAVRTSEPAVVGLPADAEVPPERWPVAGAVVEIERVTTAGTTKVVVTTDEAGVFDLPGLRGGRYRVRAYVPDIATSGGAAILFLAADEAGRIEPEVATAPTGPVVQIVAGDGAEVGGSWTMAATVATRFVDAEGRIVHRPLGGAPLSVSFAPAPVQPGETDPETGEVGEPIQPGEVSLLSALVADSDGGGAARWLVSCNLAGPVLATVSTPGASTTLALEGCRVPAPLESPVDSTGASTP